MSEEIRVDAADERGKEARKVSEVWLKSAETDIEFRFEDRGLDTGCWEAIQGEDSCQSTFEEGEGRHSEGWQEQGIKQEVAS